MQMRHSSSQFWLSLPAPGNSQCFAIGFTGSKTQLSAQHGAHCNSPKLAVPQAVCPVAAPHIGLWPLVLVLTWTSSTCSHEVSVGNYWALDGGHQIPVIPCPGSHYFWHLHGKYQNAQILKSKQSPPFLWGENPPTTKCTTFCLFVSHFLYMSLLCQGLQGQFSPSDFAAFPVSTNSSQNGSPWGAAQSMGLRKLSKKLKGCVYSKMFPWQHEELGTSHDLQCALISSPSAQGTWKQKSLQLPQASNHLQPSTGQGSLLCTEQLLGTHSLPWWLVSYRKSTQKPLDSLCSLFQHTAMPLKWRKHSFKHSLK